MSSEQERRRLIESINLLEGELRQYEARLESAKRIIQYLTDRILDGRSIRSQDRILAMIRSEIHDDLANVYMDE